HKLACCFQLLDVFRSAVTHTGTKSADQLEYGILHMALICHTSFHAFRNKLLGVFLEVTVLASVLHGRNGSHTAVNLIFTSLVQFECSRTLIASCEDTSHHADVGACSDCLGNISGILDSAVGDDRDSIPAGNVIAVHNCSDLRHADTCNHTGGTDGTRSD